MSRTIRVLVTVGIACAAAHAMPARAWASDSPEKPPGIKRAVPSQANTPNTATIRPVAIRLEASLNLLSFYSLGITGGYAFHRLFALEGTLGWEGGFMHGIMGRLRIPIRHWSSLSLGVGATGLWVPWKGEYNAPGYYLWLPAEIAWEYRADQGHHFLLGVGARVLTAAKPLDPDFSLCIFCLAHPPQIYPAARIGIGWAF